MIWPSRKHLAILGGLWLVVHVFLFSVFGVRDQFVDSIRYFEMSGHLLVHGRMESGYQVFYAIPILLLSVSRLIFPDGVAAFVLIQSVISFFACLALYRAAGVSFGNKHAGLWAAVIYLIWFDCIQWNTALMTESLAGSLTCIVIAHLATWDDRWQDRLILVLLLGICILTRPTGVLLLAAATVFLIVRHVDSIVRNRVLAAGLFTVVALLFLSGAWMMLNEWDFTDQYVRGNIVTYMDTLEGQRYYYENLRMETRGLVLPDEHLPPAEKILMFALNNPGHFFRGAVLKIFYTLSWFRPYFSFAHNAYSAVWLLIIYGCAFMGYNAIRDNALRIFCVFLIVANCLLVGISAADWDNRFFLPMQPAIVLLAGGGVAKAITCVRRRFIGGCPAESVS